MTHKLSGSAVNFNLSRRIARSGVGQTIKKIASDGAAQFNNAVSCSA
jgi:hypothetical protein